MNVKYLESFLEVAKDLNMTTAAQRLYISPADSQLSDSAVRALLRRQTF